MAKVAVYLEELNDVWEGKGAQVNWLLMEHFVRKVLRDGELDNETKVALIDEAVAAFTGRGVEIHDKPEPYLN